jgi:hypothetical protein
VSAITSHWPIDQRRRFQLLVSAFPPQLLPSERAFVQRSRLQLTIQVRACGMRCRCHGKLPQISLQAVKICLGYRGHGSLKNSPDCALADHSH